MFNEFEETEEIEIDIFDESKNDEEPKTVIVWDWDDTLFPTSFFRKIEEEEVYEKSMSMLNQIADVCQKTTQILKLSLIEADFVYIISNGSIPWLEDSFQYVPDFYKLRERIEIISAKELYSRKSKFYAEWKIMAFESVLRKVSIAASTTRLINFFSVGDSEIDLWATRIFAKDMTLPFELQRKFVKLSDRPDLCLFSHQLDFILFSMACFLNVNGNFEYVTERQIKKLI
jgi:hypothetical protein